MVSPRAASDSSAQAGVPAEPWAGAGRGPGRPRPHSRAGVVRKERRRGREHIADMYKSEG